MDFVRVECCWKEEDDWVCLYDDFVASDETITCDIGVLAFMMISLFWMAMVEEKT